MEQDQEQTLRGMPIVRKETASELMGIIGVEQLKTGDLTAPLSRMWRDLEGENLQCVKAVQYVIDKLRTQGYDQESARLGALVLYKLIERELENRSLPSG